MNYKHPWKDFVQLFPTDAYTTLPIPASIMTAVATQISDSMFRKTIRLRGKREEFGGAKVLSNIYTRLGSAIVMSVYQNQDVSYIERGHIYSPGCFLKRM